MYILINVVKNSINQYSAFFYEISDLEDLRKIYKNSDKNTLDKLWIKNLEENEYFDFTPVKANTENEAIEKGFYRIVTEYDFFVGHGLIILVFCEGKFSDTKNEYLHEIWSKWEKQKCKN